MEETRKKNIQTLLKIGQLRNQIYDLKLTQKRKTGDWSQIDIQVLYTGLTIWGRSGIDQIQVLLLSKTRLQINRKIKHLIELISEGKYIGIPQNIIKMLEILV
ncbi:Hypothetical_protein [Hexamita inflata]|uniref:Hypothetical_protein n=1 Tax=Hexamita inflata TaxID=28002 RepID=A0AA86R190_9EUKA|nr:Hypothetical protein HINF_LOCUS57456 [Hexamita inflata]